ncbi:hypothetical protein [Nonomuraea sp. NPDC003754]
MEIGAETVRQEVERAGQLFPDAVARFHNALRALPAEQADSPFVKALVEPVTLKDDTFRGRGGFVILPEWADILDRHFPRPRSSRHGSALGSGSIPGGQVFCPVRLVTRPAGGRPPSAVCPR